METTKAVIINEHSEFHWAVIPGGNEPTIRLAQEALDQAAEKAGVSLNDINYVIATGSGRENVDFANQKLPEFLCVSRGINLILPSTRTLIDLGVRKSLVIKCNEGRVKKFSSAGKCASGTGAYLDLIAGFLGLSIHEMDRMYFHSKAEVEIHSKCAIFAESEIISLIHGGAKPEDIVRGAIRGLAGQIFVQLREVVVEKDLTVIGGVAKCKSLISALQDLVNLEILVPEYPEIIGALGAALFAQESGGENK